MTSSRRSSASCSRTRPRAWPSPSRRQLKLRPRARSARRCLARPPLRPGAGFEARDPLAQGADCGELARELLDFALEHARGRDGRLFCRRPSSVRRWSAPARAPASRAARRTISAARTPPGCARMASPTSSARRRWATRIRACSIASMRDYRRSCFASVCSRPSEGAVPVQ